MTREVPIVDSLSMLQIFERTQGEDIITRMKHASGMLLGQGVSPSAMEAHLYRMQALHEFLLAHSDMRELYSDKALVVAASSCELFEPDTSLVQADQARFDYNKFNKAVAIA